MNYHQLFSAISTSEISDMKVIKELIQLNYSKFRGS